jgi:hypothetical protein
MSTTFRSANSARQSHRCLLAVMPPIRHHGQVAKLTLIGYWRSEQDPEWPDPATFVDKRWDSEERDLVAMYLSSGIVTWAAGGISSCRLCGKPNGSAEYTDGVFLWPEGLAHYIRDHHVRIPRRVVEHIRHQWSELLDDVDIEDRWWRTVVPE